MSLQQEAIEIVRSERDNWEDATAFVTDRVSFQLRNLLRQLRKNYYGIFDKPKDPTTGREKIWIPLTESTVESIIKNVDLDAKDINFIAKHEGAIGYTAIIRNKVRQILDKENFGETLDKMERDLCINGTAVWKTIKNKDSFDIKSVDLLNVYIDPTAESIQKAYRFTERALLLEDEVRGMSGWINKDVEGTYNLSPTESRLNFQTSSGVTGTAGSKLVDVWEMWGKIPEYLITGNKKDTKEIDGHIIVSGLDSQGKEQVHLIEANKGGIKPYEECWYRRVPGRWYGKGPAEMVMMLQLYQNTIVNIRINRSYVSQLGLFKIKRNSGITPQMISRLAANGAVAVNSMDDIQELIVNEASAASYRDEDVANDWTQKVTQAFEVITGETLPSSTTATSAAIQSRSAGSGMAFIRKGIGMFLERWMQRQVLPNIGGMLSAGEVVRLSGKVQELRDLDEQTIAHLLLKEIDKRNAKGQRVSPEQIEREKERLREKVKKMGDSRFVEVVKKINPTDYDVKVVITNESIDTSVLANNLVQMLQLAPEYKPVIMRELFDLFGRDARQLEDVSRQLPTPVENPNQPTQDQALPKNFSMPALTTAANTAQEVAA